MAKKSRTTPSKLVQDLTGQRFGNLVVKSFHSTSNKNYHAKWLCICDCGNEKITYATLLKRGRITRCGYCTNTVHISQDGLTRDYDREYAAWAAMISRCYKESNASFKHYGGRGITVCERWLSGENEKTGFQCFLEDMGPRPSRKHSVERDDYNKGYALDNCRWATTREQGYNRRSNVVMTAHGVTKTVAEWIRDEGLGQAYIYQLLRAGMPPEEALAKVRKVRDSKKAP